MTAKWVGCLASLALLAACSDEPVVETAEDENRTAEGEVLGGTISDDMIPLDQVRSQSPPLREEGTGSSSASAPLEPGNADAEAAAEPEEEPIVAESANEE